MFDHEPIVGTSLPQGALALTFDDGPGPKTVALAEYLSEEGIAATFFVCGKHVMELPGVIDRLRALGHVVANHTQTHPDLVSTLAAGGDVLAEVAATDALIRDREQTLFFRPPYGRWSPAVADVLNAHPELAAGYVGPVNWDVDARDWASWRDDVDPVDCAHNYLRAIEEVGRGIVLMHDCTADNDAWKLRNRTDEAIALLVPDLLARGYQFVPLL